MPDPIDLITANPDENNPSTIATEIDLFVTQIKAAIPQMNSAFTALNLNSVTGTSSTSVAIGLGSKSFTADTSKSWLPGMWLSIADTAAPSTNAMYGTVTSYNSGTGALVVNVVYIIGSGTKTAWTIAQSSPSTQPIGMYLLQSLTASASSTIDLETTFDSSYDDYIITGTDINCGGSAAMYCRLKLGGAYSTSTYRYHGQNVTSSAGTYNASVSGSAAQIIMSNNASYLNFMMFVRAPTSANKKLVNWTGVYHESGGDIRMIYGAGGNDSTSALTGVRFLLSTGTITSGSFKLYGIRKS